MPEMYGTAELAKAAGVKERTLSGYLSRGQCPAPDYRLACGPIWTEATVRPWLDSRDEKLERVVAQADAAWSVEVDAMASEVYFTNRYETAKRNVHNGRLRKLIERHERVHGPGSGQYLTLRNQGFLPTVKEEARRYAETKLAQTEDYVLPETPRLLDMRERAVMRLQARQAVRAGSPDGIPF